MQQFERLEHAATTCVACNSDAGETEDPAILMSSTEKRDRRPASAVSAQFSQEQYGNCYDACLYLQSIKRKKHVPSLIRTQETSKTHFVSRLPCAFHVTLPCVTGVTTPRQFF